MEGRPITIACIESSPSSPHYSRIQLLRLVAAFPNRLRKGAREAKPSETLPALPGVLGARILRRAWGSTDHLAPRIRAAATETALCVCSRVSGCSSRHRLPGRHFREALRPRSGRRIREHDGHVLRLGSFAPESDD